MKLVAPEMSGKIRLFGIEVDALTLDQTLELMFRLADSREPSQHVVLNASKVVQMEHDPKLREIISSCEVVNADGISVVWASRLLGTPLPERVTGIDLFYAIVERASRTGHSLYFLGATDEALARMVQRFTNEFPGLKIAGFHNGYWDDESVDELIGGIRATAPDFLFLAIPSPRKEFWLYEHLRDLNVPVAMGVGGSFDVMAGLVRRAPAWVQHLGCEWLYRLSQEPRRMWKRYLVGNARFMHITMRAVLRRLVYKQT